MMDCATDSAGQYRGPKRLSHEAHRLIFPHRLQALRPASGPYDDKVVGMNIRWPKCRPGPQESRVISQQAGYDPPLTDGFTASLLLQVIGVVVPKSVGERLDQAQNLLPLGFQSLNCQQTTSSPGQQSD
jgi:hypothetical protein